MLLMVADAGARKATQTSEAKILVRPITFADGAPTFAFESGSATGWYTMVRDGDRFVPLIVLEPSRELKEPFKAYKDRWWAFYASQVNKKGNRVLGWEAQRRNGFRRTGDGCGERRVGQAQRIGAGAAAPA